MHQTHLLSSLLLLTNIHSLTQIHLLHLCIQTIFKSPTIFLYNLLIQYNLYATSTIEIHPYSKTTLSLNALSSAHTPPLNNLVFATNNTHINDYLYAGNVLSTCTKGHILIDIINLSASLKLCKRKLSSPLLTPSYF